MTGFGKANVTTEGKRICIEIRSLNGKQFDLSSRIPSCYRDKEGEIRSFLMEKILRGKVDFSISYESAVSNSISTINQEQLVAYRNQLLGICNEEHFSLPDDYLLTLLKLPSVIGTSVENLDEVEWTSVQKGIEEAMNHFLAFRKQEGESLEKVFREKAQRILILLTEIEPFEEERVQLIRSRIQEHLKEFVGVEYDKNRLEQEMIYYIEKLDVHEEKQRLRNHIQYLLETLSHGEGQGKKLGFILQEMGREINTLGSKSNHSQMQRIVVEMKDELEQMKEQVLNVL